MTSLESRRTRGFIPWSKIGNWLHALRSIWISTTRPDGRPHAVPVWYVWDSHGLYFISARHLQKAENLARQPWVVVHAGDGDDVIIMRGPVEIMADRPELEHIDSLYRAKYVDPGIGMQATIFEPAAIFIRSILSVSWHGNMARSPIERTGSLSRTNGRISD